MTGQAVFGEEARGAGGGDHAKSERGEVADDRQALGFVLIGEGDEQRRFVGLERNVDAAGDHGLVERAREVGVDAKISPVDFISGPRLMSTPVSLEKEKTGALTAMFGWFGCRAVLVALVGEAAAERRPHRGLDHRDAGDLAEIGDGARGARVDLDDIRLIVFDDELDVHQADDVQRFRKTRRILHHLIDRALLDRLRRVDGHRVAAVDAGALDMLHDAGQMHPPWPSAITSTSASLPVM